MVVVVAVWLKLQNAYKSDRMPGGYKREQAILCCVARVRMKIVMIRVIMSCLK